MPKPVAILVAFFAFTLPIVFVVLTQMPSGAEGGVPTGTLLYFYSPG